MRVSLELIHDGSTVFVDSNIFVYGADTTSRRYQACKNLLERVARGGLSGVTSTSVLTEVFHVTSMMEVSKRFKRADPEGFAKKNPDILKQLKSPLAVFNSILSIPNLEIVGESTQIVSEAARMALETGLLITDAKIAATCKAAGVQSIATNDRDFERVSLKVWGP